MKTKMLEIDFSGYALNIPNDPVVEYAYLPSGRIVVMGQQDSYWFEADGHSPKGSRLTFLPPKDELSNLRHQLTKWENREASICPEDFGFEEVISKLRAVLEKANEYGDHWQGIAQAETAKLNQSRDELDEAIKVVEHLYGVLEYLKLDFPNTLEEASAFLARTKGEKSHPPILEHEWYCPSPCNKKHSRYTETCQSCKYHRT